MKRKLYVLGFLIILFTLFIGVRFFLLNAQDTFGKVRIVATPSATVFIDNVAAGKTPYEEKIKIGEYHIKLIPEATATTTATWQGKVKIYKNTLSYIKRELGATDLESAGEIFTVTKMEKTKKKNSGEIYVETDPNGAIVYLDNDEKGIAPVILADIIKGDHEISVFMPGFLRRTEKIKIDSGYRVNTHFKLAVDPNQKLITSSSDEAKLDASPSAKAVKYEIVIKDTVQSTELGYLRVREEPTVTSSESARVKAGETFDFIEEKDGWYKIKYDDKNEGWVYSQYAEKVEK